MKFWRQKQSGVMRIPSFEWVNILEYMNLVQYEKKYFSFFQKQFRFTPRFSPISERVI